jgi:ATP-dependent DNA helicase RecQ
VLFDAEKSAIDNRSKPSKKKWKCKKVKQHPFPFETLRKLRYEISKEEEVPAYVIFSDAALRQMKRIDPWAKN